MLHWVWVTLASVAAVVLLLCGGGGYWFYLRPQWALDAEIARIRAAGEPITPEEMRAYHRQMVGSDPIGQGEWVVVDESAEQAFVDAERNYEYLLSPEEVDDPEAYVAALRSTSDQLRSTIDRLINFDDRGRYIFAEIGYDSLDDLPQEFCEDLRWATRLLAVECYRATVDDRPERIYDAQFAILRMISAIGRTPEPIVQLIRANLVRMLQPCVERTAETLNDDQLLSIQNKLKSIKFKDMATESLICERSRTLFLLRNTSPAGDRLFLLRSLRKYLGATRLSIREWNIAFDTASHEVAHDTGFGDGGMLLLIGATETLAKAFARAEAYTRAMRVFVAAIRIEKLNGRWPQEMGELVPRFLPEPVLDPYTDQPFQILVENDQLVVYGVGSNGIDDGRDPSFGSDGEPLDIVIQQQSLPGAD
ncbi:hypothetical protein [Stratiformator vulcanicus]|nr:hypothetical protein [Stratiformator vulcanicus]